MSTFVAISQAKTLTEAAILLSAPLSSVSRALKRVEIAAALVLVRRDAEGLELTGAGRDYLIACQRVLQSQQEAQTVIARHQGTPEGSLNIGAPLPFARSVLSQVLPEFQRRYPKLKSTSLSTARIGIKDQKRRMISFSKSVRQETHDIT